MSENVLGYNSDKRGACDGYFMSEEHVTKGSCTLFFDSMAFPPPFFPRGRCAHYKACNVITRLYVCLAVHVVFALQVTFFRSVSFVTVCEYLFQHFSSSQRAKTSLRHQPSSVLQLKITWRERARKGGIYIFDRKTGK